MAVSHPGLELAPSHKTGWCQPLSMYSGQVWHQEGGRGWSSATSGLWFFLLLVPIVSENQRHPIAQEISEWQEEGDSLSLQSPCGAVVT